MEYHDVFPEGRFGVETYSAAFQNFVTSLMHGRNMPFKIISSVGHVSAVGAREKLSSERIAH